MAITFVGNNVNTGDPTTSFTVAIHADTLTDDICILSVSNGGGTGDPAVADDDTGGNAWAKITSGTQGTFNGSAWWKRATSGSASKTVTVSSLTDNGCGTLSVYRGCLASGTPHENASAVGHVSGDEDTDGITPSVNGSLVNLSVMSTGNDSPATQACTDPGSLTERGDAQSNSGSKSNAADANAVQTTAGVTGTFTWTQNNKATVTVVFDLLPVVIGTGFKAAWARGSILIPGPLVS